MQNIKNIIFDLGGVLLNIDYNLARRAFESYGISQFDEMYSQSGADKLFQQLEKGEISEENFYTELNKCTGLQLTPVEIKNAWNAMLLDFREESLRFLEGLKPKYQLYLLSNTNFIHINAFNDIYHSKERKGNFDDFFTKAYYSCAIGFRKPDAECYAWVLKDIGATASETLFIDDSLQNVEAAEQAGMQTVHLTPGKNIEDIGL